MTFSFDEMHDAMASKYGPEGAKLQLLKFEKRADPLEIVATLSELLERAKAGEFESVVTVCLRPDGSFCTRSSGYKNSLQVMGSLYCALNDTLKASEK